VTTGREVLGFETELAAGVNARQAVAVSSCKAAIGRRARGRRGLRYAGRDDRRALDRRPSGRARARRCAEAGPKATMTDLQAAMWSRDEVSAELSERGVGTSAQIPVHRLAYFRQVALIPPGGMTGADALLEQLPPLPIYPRLTDDQVDAVCTAIADTACRQFSRKGAE
jgi:dTDP-4-amino-4,6-dideoxygalactose transaminase